MINNITVSYGRYDLSLMAFSEVYSFDYYTISQKSHSVLITAVAVTDCSPLIPNFVLAAIYLYNIV